MIVKRGKPGFTPIHITLETQEEANIMWTALHDYKIMNPFENISKVITPMWESYNVLYGDLD